MATKASTKKSTSSRANAAKKTTKKKTVAAKATTKPATVKAVVVEKSVKKKRLPENLPGVILAELFGTFVLTVVALAASSFNVLYAGLVVMVMVLAVGAVSQAHFNPAISFGLWTARRINWATMLVYIGSQLFGALLALTLTILLSGMSFGIDFSQFFAIDWTILAIELVTTAIFAFGVAAVTSRSDLTNGAKALGAGMALTIALVAGGVLLSYPQTSAMNTYQSNMQNASATGESTTKAPRVLLVDGVLANPAVALASVEMTEQQMQMRMQGYNMPAEKTAPTRFSAEVLLGTLAGATLGANLFVLMSYKRREV
ncbi:MAG: aquaporin [Acidobacteriota bacterium]